MGSRSRARSAGLFASVIALGIAVSMTGCDGAAGGDDALSAGIGGVWNPREGRLTQLRRANDLPYMFRSMIVFRDDGDLSWCIKMDRTIDSVR